MSLSKKTIIIIGIAFLCLILLGYGSSRYIMMKDYTKLENQDARQNVERALSALGESIDNIDTVVSDWAWWDATYIFIEDKNKEYIDVNISDLSFINLGINLLLYINNSGEIVYGGSYDYTNNIEMPMPSDLESLLFEKPVIWQRNSPESYVSGIYVFKEGPMLIVSRPILRSDFTGPVNGSLIMGRYLDSEEIMRLSANTHVLFDVLSFEDPDMDQDIKTMLESSEEVNPVYLQPINDDIINGYGLIKDIFGNPVLAVKVDLLREIHKQGEKSLRYFLFLLVIFVFVFGVMVVLLLEKNVLSRLTKLSNNFTLISDSGDHSMRLQASGNDELTRLAESANKMLDSLQKTHHKLSDTKERYRTLTENAYDLICEISNDGRYLYASPNYKDILGYEPPEIINKSVIDFIYPEDRNKVSYAVSNIDGSGSKELTYRMVSKNGDVRCFESTARIYENLSNGETRLVAVSRDITEKQRYEETIKFQAFHDSLTGLPNRLLFKDRLSLALAHCKRNKNMLAIIYLDLDRFKLINDTLGHEVGDLLLCEVAERLKECVREGDTVARLGGDEFTIMLPGIINEDGAAKVAEKVLESIRLPIIIREHELYISTSAGIAIYPSDGDDAETLLKNADTAMYLSKEKNRNNYQFYTPALNKKAHDRLLIENQLRRAIERKEFVLHYQPKINISTGEITGVEALVRWNHPERGLLPPGEFIPVAEETGLIIPLGEWVLRTACSQNKYWQKAGYVPLAVSVNVSGRQFCMQNLVEVIRRVLKETGLEPYWLEIEITESTAMQNSVYTIETLYKLKKMGIQLSIDDFGTGYSSLGQLKRFPIDKLKIDRTFVMEIGEIRDSEVIASTVIALCKSLKLGVVAEGVETEEQRSFLHKHQCSEMQGFLFSKPLSPEDLEALLAERKPSSATQSNN